MTKWTITVIGFVAQKLVCTYKHPFAGKPSNIICKDSFFPSCSHSLQKIMFAGRAPQPHCLHCCHCVPAQVGHFWLPPWFILDSMAIQVIACLLVLWLAFHALPFFSPCKPFATHAGRRQAESWTVDHTYSENTQIYYLGTFMCCSLCTSLDTNNSTVVPASGRNPYKLCSSHCPVKYIQYQRDMKMIPCITKLFCTWVWTNALECKLIACEQLV